MRSFGAGTTPPAVARIAPPASTKASLASFSSKLHDAIPSRVRSARIAPPPTAWLSKKFVFEMSASPRHPTRFRAPPKPAGARLPMKLQPLAVSDCAYPPNDCVNAPPDPPDELLIHSLLVSVTARLMPTRIAPPSPAALFP